MNDTKKKILIVDDEEDLTWSLSKRLCREGEFLDVRYANSGNAALNMLASHQFDLLVTDLRMPGIDGFDVLRKVKETHPEIEVIIVTGHGSEEDRRLCMDLGAFAYLQKPLDINVLSDTIQKANEKVRRKKIEGLRD